MPATAHGCRIQGHIAQLWIRERRSRAIMLEKPRDELKLRHWCIRKLLKGEDVETIRLTAKVSRRTLYYWLERFQRRGGADRRLQKTTHNPPPGTQRSRESHPAQTAAWMVWSSHLSPSETRRRRSQQRIHLHDTPQPHPTSQGIRA